MRNTQKTELQNELKAAGASSAELGTLVGIADRLSNLKEIVQTRPAYRAPTKRLRVALSIGIPSVLSLALGMLLVIGSQTVEPGSLLYPVQKLSDSMAVSMDPSFRATVMMKRADQVQELVTNHASSSEVLATLADYQRQATDYKSMTSNYAAFEYCKHSLQQAAISAPAPEKQAINSTLQSLNDV